MLQPFIANLSKWIIKNPKTVFHGYRAVRILVPRVGFTHICMIDPKSAGHVRLLQKREGSAAWNPADRLN